MRLLFERDLTPHPQYAAFYNWLQHDFKASAVLHFGMHGTVEWLPGAPLGTVSPIISQSSQRNLSLLFCTANGPHVSHLSHIFPCSGISMTYSYSRPVLAAGQTWAQYPRFRQQRFSRLFIPGCIRLQLTRHINTARCCSDALCPLSQTGCHCRQFRAVLARCLAGSSAKCVPVRLQQPL